MVKKEHHYIQGHIDRLDIIKWKKMQINLENQLMKTCWVGYKQIGMKKKNGKMVPNCVKEDVELYYEENGKGYGYTFEFIKT